MFLPVACALIILADSVARAEREVLALINELAVLAIVVAHARACVAQLEGGVVLAVARVQTRLIHTPVSVLAPLPPEASLIQTFALELPISCKRKMVVRFEKSCKIDQGIFKK